MDGVTGLLRNLPLPPGQAVGLVVGVVLDRLRPARMPGPRAAHRTAGALLMVSGSSLVVWALGERRRRTTGRFDLEQPQSLVTTGPYARSRHPMYVGWWLIHLGFGVLRGSAWSLVTLPMAILAEHRGVRAEERALVETFGPQFERYAEQVPRYVGTLGRLQARQLREQHARQVRPEEREGQDHRDQHDHQDAQRE